MWRAHNMVVSLNDTNSVQTDGDSQTSSPVRQPQNPPRDDDESKPQPDDESEVEYEIKREAHQIAQHITYPRIQPETQLAPQYSSRYQGTSIPWQLLGYVPDLNPNYGSGPAFKVEDEPQYQVSNNPWRASKRGRALD
ncbi:hypothetical protein O1611_g2332 [Lasiodiplodia mahajangana]|uniref:Uncharacterized protein n=1 Tax=Lasiodiplodia mahajangana TaxID=1108764 RepID=A0ACC2JVJ5_9PEZI|nr:hypothetical protein O1611_g2332 [Lasiodiplodia mahajangana]